MLAAQMVRVDKVSSGHLHCESIFLSKKQELM